MCTLAHRRAHTHTNIHTNKHTNTEIHAHTNLRICCVCVCVCECVCLYMSVCLCVCVSMCLCACVAWCLCICVSVCRERDRECVCVHMCVFFFVCCWHWLNFWGFIVSLHGESLRSVTDSQGIRCVLPSLTWIYSPRESIVCSPGLSYSGFPGSRRLTRRPRTRPLYLNTSENPILRLLSL